MQARMLPAQRGWVWIFDGFILWKRNPALLTFLVFGCSLVLLLIASVPLVGQVAMSLIMPAMSLGIFNGCKAVHERRKAGPEVLISGFKQNFPELVKIGGLYLAGTLIVMGISLLIDGDMNEKFGKAMLGKAEWGETFDDPSFTLALLVATVGSTPLMMAYWFAPLLAGWGKVPAAKALFFSFVACLRNWRPFLTYGIGLMTIAMMAGVLISILGLVSPLLSILPAMIFPVVFIPVVFASFYTNALDVFEHIGPHEPN
ncbi:BPSS1780 family membrane protein [Zoogloea sp.]|uniref:BPSS1780 family membrane protein n=1 Tax=Zoogloea sp. TaxID=49181 RepID=UPI00262E5993|nr:BPSS1780 family membrane protein [Zoogloea sp.]MDD3352390.1 BPSS1780 family membrane protein [Zoogloea sp.]